MRRFYAKRLSYKRYQVTCTHPDGRHEDLGMTMPECSRDQLLDWLVQHVQAGESLLINEATEVRS